MEETIVKEWLRSLGMEQYTISFIDNGYDDLEICKQIDAPDLDAIGVVDPSQRTKILQAVQILKVEGAASVYFTVEEAQAATQENSSNSSSCNHPHSIPSQEPKKSGTGSALSTPVDRTHLFPGISEVDAYEAGRAELVRLPQLQLRKLIQENLKKDNVNLILHPYTTKDGDRGVLEGLASRYADQFNTHFQDVLDHLEFLRSQEWGKVLSSKSKSIVGSHSQLYPQKSELNIDRKLELWSPRSSSSSSLDHNDDYPVYVPGKYNPSSCLSDAEEDQIYGFTGGTNHSSVVNSGPGYLNPRSHCIYELPPSRRNQNGVKKKLGLGRLLKTLKRDLKKSNETRNKTYNVTHSVSSVTAPRPICAAPDLSSTPLVVLPGYSSPTNSHCSQSSKSHSSGQSFIVTSASAPGTPGSSGPIRDSGLQQAIERLKEQEIKRRREEQFREHEQMLQDIRHGLQQSKNMKGFGSMYSQFPLCTESSYMYDDEVLAEEDSSRHPIDLIVTNPTPILLHHWYDEPPYESDPEDFLIGISKEEQQSRELLPNNVRLSKDEDVISLKTAGDISLPRDVMNHSSDWVSPKHLFTLPGTSEITSQNGLRKPHQQKQHSLYVSHHQRQGNQNYLQMDVRPPNLVKSDGSVEASSSSAAQLSSKSHEKRGTWKGQDMPFDVQSVNSKLSNLSIETSLSNRANNETSESSGTNSGSQSDLDDEERKDSESLVGRMRMLQRDMQKRISCLKNCRDNASSEAANGLFVLNEGDNLRQRLEGGYVRYQRQNSLPVKLKQVETRVQHHYRLPQQKQGIVIGRARALVDYQPSLYDKDALKFKKGDIIDIISKNPSGLWRGHLNGKIGHFKFILVEEIETMPALHYSRPTRRYGITHGSQALWFQKPGALREILAKFNLSQLSQLFILNGYDDIERFRNFGMEDLDHLGIGDPQLRSQVLCAVRFLQETLEAYDSAPYSWSHNGGSSSFVRHVNGRVSLPLKCSQGFYPLEESGYEREGIVDQLYENTSVVGYLYRNAALQNDKNNLDNLEERLEHSSSSTDTSSGYHSRPTFNIPVAVSGADTPTSSQVGLQGSLVIHKTTSPPTEGETSDSQRDSHNAQRDSYHAHVARVHSSPSPTPLSGAESTEGETAPSC